MSIAELISPTPSTRARARRRAAAALPQFPAIEPGQLWLIEVPAAGGAPSALLRHVLDRVNVVIYDRGLADLVGRSLPLGTYAEPGASTNSADDPAAARAVRFACDGWSVARLVPVRPTQRERVVRVRRLIEELAATRAASDVAVTLRGDLADGVCEPTETRLDQLDRVIVTYPRDARLTVLVGGAVGQADARLHAVAGNGLAG